MLFWKIEGASNVQKPCTFKSKKVEKSGNGEMDMFLTPKNTKSKSFDLLFVFV